MGRTARVTREQVLAAARDEFVHRGFEGATLAGIGARLQISPAALLRHAPTKRELFLASMRPAGGDMTPLAFLETLDGSEDPRAVLRRVGETMVPFLEARISEVVARWVYFKQVPGVGRVPLPFDPEAKPTPPQRNLRFLEGWFRRAIRKCSPHACDNCATIRFFARRWAVPGQSVCVPASPGTGSLRNCSRSIVR